MCIRDSIKSISKVKVDDTEYAATGRGSKVIVKEDGTLDLTDIQVTDATVFEITAVGYKNNLTFTYKEAENTFELNTSSKTLYTKGRDVYKRQLQVPPCSCLESVRSLRNGHIRNPSMTLQEACLSMQRKYGL